MLLRGAQRLDLFVLIASISQKESQEKWATGCTVNNRLHIPTSYNAYRLWRWREENIVWILLKWQSVLRQTDWWNAGWAHLAHPFNRNPSNCLHNHFSAYMNGAAQYPSYQTLMVSTLWLSPAVTPGSPDITAFSCLSWMTKRCLIITLPTAVSDRRQFNCLF